MSMKLETYKDIMSVIESFHGRNYECEILLQQKFPDIMPETLRSIYEIFYQKKMKRIHVKFHRASKDLYRRYKAAVKNKEPVGILVRMSDEIEISPALLARLIVEEYYKEAGEEYIIKVVDDSDNSGRRNVNLRGDDSLRSEDTEYVLSDNDNTENSSTSTSNTDSKASDEVVQKDSEKQQAGNPNTSLEKLSPVKENIETKASKSASARGRKKRNRGSRRKQRVGSSSSTAEKSDTQTTTTTPTTPTAAAPPPTAAAAACAPAAKAEEHSKIKVSDLINDTTLIKDPDLAYEVFLCHVEDDQYGPTIDCYRQSLGHHYEVRLLQWVKNNNLVVQDEAALRKFGFDKTPDIKLDLPIAVNGSPIMWIESKAIFGDEDTHRTYYNNQYIRYWNRFGPGLVIYWLGYLETILTTEERRIMICHDLPNDIKIYNPDSIRVRRFTEKPFGTS